MKKLLFCAIVLLTAVVATAQVKVTSPLADLKIQISKCTLSNRTLTLDFIINNQGKDCSFAMVSYWDKTFVADDEGNKYMSRNRGDETILIGLPNNPETDFNNTYPNDMPTKIRMIVNDVDPMASSLTMVSISTNLGENKNIIFRNIPINKD